MKKVALFFLFGAWLCAASPSNQVLSDDLKNIDPSSKVKVIVQWKTAPTQGLLDRVLGLGATVLGQLPLINAVVYTLTGSALQGLASDPNVAYISPDRPLRAKLDYSASAVNAGAAWTKGLTGSGVTVAVIDSGMNPTLDLGNGLSIVYSEDFTGKSGGLLSLLSLNKAPDLFGHGQHVAGIIASSGFSSSCFNCTRSMKGIAPGVKLVNLRALDENGGGTDSSVIGAINRAIALKNTYHIRIINLSLGRPVYESYKQDPLCQAVERAWKAGIVVVVAAGNDGRDNSMGTNGYGTIEAPGNDPYVITVGAMKSMGTEDRSDDRIASYSSKGPSLVDGIVKPDIVAPGNQIVSLLASPTDTLAKQLPANRVPLSYYQATRSTNLSNAYFTLSGTSMATPVVSGAAADLLQAHPELTPDQVKARLMLTASKTFPICSTATDSTTGESFVSYYDPFTVGAGYLDLAAALASPTVASGTALSPTVVFDSVSGTASLLADVSSAWYVNPVFNPDAVWVPNTFLSGASGASNAAVDANMTILRQLGTVDANMTVLRQLNTVDASRTVLRQLNTIDANRTVLRDLDTLQSDRTVLRDLSILTAGEN